MNQINITLVPLRPDDREQFILDNQWAFKYGAQQEFGLRDTRTEEGNWSEDDEMFVFRKVISEPLQP